MRPSLPVVWTVLAMLLGNRPAALSHFRCSPTLTLGFCWYHGSSVFRAGKLLGFQDVETPAFFPIRWPQAMWPTISVQVTGGLGTTLLPGCPHCREFFFQMSEVNDTLQHVCCLLFSHFWETPKMKQEKVYLAHSLQRFRFIISWFQDRVAWQRGNDS